MAIGNDLFKAPHFLGHLPLFQRTKPHPNNFGTVVVTSRLDHLVDEVLPIVCQRSTHTLIVANYWLCVKSGMSGFAGRKLGSVPFMQSVFGPSLDVYGPVWGWLQPVKSQEADEPLSPNS